MYLGIFTALIGVGFTYVGRVTDGILLLILARLWTMR